MSLENFISNPHSNWMEGTGPAADVVVSSRVRLARNIGTLPFPHHASDEQANQVINMVEKGVEHLNRQHMGKFEMFKFSEVPLLVRQVLVEKHLISPQHAKESVKGAVVLSSDESVSIMVNEEDHLRIQCLYPGFQLDEAYQLASKVDDALESEMDYSFCEQRGYLTACPTNIGTGIRASVMLHLPALVMSNQIGRVVNATTQLGLAVRGLYGEGTDAIGNMFQVSNQLTLGHSEEEIIANLKGITRQIIDQERATRQMLLKEMGDQLTDRVCRAYGILSHAHIITSQEAIKLLSDLRLGIILGVIKEVTIRTVNDLIVVTRPSFLQYAAGRELGTFERDLHRAKLIRHYLKNQDQKR